MQFTSNPLNRNINEQKTQLPVKSPNIKLLQDDKKKYLVSCLSSMPLAFQTSKEQIRIKYLHDSIQGRGNQTGLVPNLKIGPELNTSMAPAQVSIRNDFLIKNSGMNVSVNVSKPVNQMTAPFNNPPNKVPNIFTKKNNNIPINNNNPLPSNQLQTNQPQFPNMFGPQTSTISPPGLHRQTSFGAIAETQNVQPAQNVPLNTQQGQTLPTQPFNQPFEPITTTNLGNQTTPFGISSANPPSGQLGGTNINQPGSQIPGQTTQIPSFGRRNLQGQPSQSLFTQQPAVSIFNSQNLTTPNAIHANLAQQVIPINQVVSKLDQNIKQLLQSKPNLWNMLALDPNYKQGFNEKGRIYVKSVLQRIIDENILSEQSLNQVIIQIYKQMYGPENLEKIIQNKKNQISSFQKIKKYDLDSMLSQSYDKLNAESVFPKNFSSISDDFYRSSRKKLSKLVDNRPLLKFQGPDDKFKLERRYFKVKKPKNLQVQFKYIEVKKFKEAEQNSQNVYSPENLEKVAENINEMRTEQRKHIMPTADELPNIEGFEIVPSVQTLSTFTKFELVSVPKVSIQNQWGIVSFKAPISLLRKNLKQCIVINQKSLEIIDEQWKLREAEITFKKFAEFEKLDEQDQDALEEKIINWCEKQSYELIRIDRDKGEVVIQI